MLSKYLSDKWRNYQKNKPIFYNLHKLKKCDLGKLNLQVKNTEQILESNCYTAYKIS